MDVLTYGLLNKKVEEAKNVSGEKITEAVNTYLNENPPTTGATAEQAAQIDKNVADIGELKGDISNLSENGYTGNYIIVNDYELGYRHGRHNLGSSTTIATTKNTIKIPKGSVLSINNNDYNWYMCRADGTQPVNGWQSASYTFTDDLEVYVELTRKDRADIDISVLDEIIIVDGRKKSKLLTMLEQTYRQEYSVGINKDYSTLTECLLDLQGNNSNKTIYIDSGEYDIYEEIGGDTFAQTITNNDWRYWSIIVPPNTKIIGLGNVVLNFILPDNIQEINQYASGVLSALNIMNNFEMENVTINCKNCRYGIHDDGASGNENDNTLHKYKNVTVNKYAGKGYPNAFGGGIGSFTDFIFENCIFNSYGIGLSFHNRNNKYGGKININDCVFKGGTYGLRFGAMSSLDETKKYVVNIFNSLIISKIGYINEDNVESRKNPFELTLIKCNTTSVDSSAFDTLQLPPIIYSE